LTGDLVTVGLKYADVESRLRFLLAATQAVPLRRDAAAVQSMNLEVLHEHTTS
jgi:glutamate dehydrogenase